MVRQAGEAARPTHMGAAQVYIMCVCCVSSQSADAGTVIGIIVAALAGLFLFISLKKAVFMVGAIAIPSPPPP